MVLTDMPQPAGDYRSMRMVYYDGNSRIVHWNDQEAAYPDGRLIVSRTDLDGYITHANAAFIELSGYSREELVGAPHYILRHPDMPKAAFADLWSTIMSGRKWNGYVKNLRKDGAHYWVYATAIPNVRNDKVVGYTSVRRKPSRKRIEELIPVYRQWLESECAADSIQGEPAP